MIIDFEYALVAPRGFDLANYFLEYAADYDSGHPDHQDYKNLPADSLRLDFLKAYLSPHDGPCTDVDGFLREVESYEAAAHLHWAYWGIIQAASKLDGFPGDFDYLFYAWQRFQQFSQIISKREQ